MHKVKSVLNLDCFIFYFLHNFSSKPCYVSPAIQLVGFYRHTIVKMASHTYIVFTGLTSLENNGQVLHRFPL